MREAVRLAVVPGTTQGDTREAQIERAAAWARDWLPPGVRTRPPAGDPPLAASSYLVGGKRWTFVRPADLPPMDLAEAAQSAAALERIRDEQAGTG